MSLYRRWVTDTTDEGRDWSKMRVDGHKGEERLILKERRDWS